MKNHITARHLVSDDDEKSNSGVTLPGTVNATHNISLSPLFLGYFGRVYDYVVGNVWVKVATGRGNIGIFRAATAAKSNDTTYRLWIGTHSLSPSDQNTRAWTYSLRCLVSTNNG